MAILRGRAPSQRGNNEQVSMLTARFCDKAFLFTKFTLSSRNKNNNAIKYRRLSQRLTKDSRSVCLCHIAAMSYIVTPSRSIWAIIKLWIALSPHHKYPFVLRKMLFVKMKYRPTSRLREKIIFTNSKFVTSCFKFPRNNIMMIIACWNLSVIVFLINLFSH